MTQELALQLLKNGIVVGLLYGLFAYGLSMILEATGIFHLASVVSLAVGAYGLWWFLDHGASAPLAVLGACVAGGVVALFIEFVIYAPLRRARAGELVLLVASLTVLSLGQGILTLVFGSDPKTLVSGEFMAWHHTVLGVSVQTYDVLVVIASLAVFVGLFVTQRYTRLGLAFRALGDNPDLARIRGVRVTRIYIVLMFAVGVVAALTGVLLESSGAASPDMGFNLLVMSIVALAIGGVGSIAGAMIAGCGVGIVQSGLAYYTNAGQADLALFALLFVLILLRPNGIGAHTVRTA